MEGKERKPEEKVREEERVFFPMCFRWKGKSTFILNAG